MKDSRPLSERFDLPYVRRKHFADRWTGRLGFIAAALTAVTVGAYQMKGDDRPYTAGDLTKAHDMFASDCLKCHEASADRGLRGYLMPATDSKCLKCHENQAGLHATNQTDLFTMPMPGHPDVRTSANCAALALHQSTASNMIDRLETGKLIRKERTSADQRVVRLYLTEEGIALRERAPSPARGLLPEARLMQQDELVQLQASLDGLLKQIKHLDEGFGMQPLPFTE